MLFNLRNNGIMPVIPEGVPMPMFSTAAPIGSAESLNSTSSQLTQQQEKRKKQRFNSEMIDFVLSGKSVQEISEKFEDNSYVWNAVCIPTKTSVLHLAAIFGRRDLIEKIVENAESSPQDPLIHCDYANRTALHFAAWNGHPECLRVLLNSSCKKHLNTKTVAERDQGERIPFETDWADSFTHKHQNVQKLMPDIPVGSTPLHAATTRCHPECLQVLIEYGASTDIRDDQGLLAFDVFGINIEPEQVLEPEVLLRTNVSIPAPNSGRNVAPRSTAFSFIEEKTEFSLDNIVSSDLQEAQEATESKSDPPRPERNSNVIFAERAERLVKGLRLSRFEGTSTVSSGEALHAAVACNSELLVDFHLSRGADPTALNPSGETVVFVALKKLNWPMLERLLKMFPDLANMPNSSGDMPIHAAAHLDANDAIALLLEYGANPLMLTKSRSSILHVAATYGRTELLRELLSGGRADPIYQLVDAPDKTGRTPLHCAVECSSQEASEKTWNILVRAGATIEALTNDGRSVLHTAIFCSNDSMLSLILRANASSVGQILEQRDDFDFTPLLFAINQLNEFAVQSLLDAGASLAVHMTITEIGGNCSALHLAAHKGFYEIVPLLLDRRPGLLHEKNELGWPPLYVAAYCQRSEVVSELLSHGADLAWIVCDMEGKRKSTMTEIVEKIRQAGALIEKVLDSKITDNELLEGHPDCEIVVKYDVLIPEVDDVLQSGRQMRVVDAILNCGAKNCKQLICHPVVRSFLIKRWAAIWPCYWFLVVLHVLMVVAHTGLITGAVWGDLDSPQLLLSRVTLVIVAIFIALEELIRASQMARIYIRDSQTWLKWASLILAVFVASENPEYIHATTHPTALETLSSTQSTLALIAKERLWVRHIVSLSALTTWIELLLILSRTPTLGLRVQMFYKVAVSVIKVLLTFSILLIGFSFAFMVQFRGEAPFATILGSLGQTLVMMTAEFNYNDLFNEGDGFLSRIPFFLFLLFVAIVLMNLLVGLAVSDINYLEDTGRRRVLEQQAAFLIVLENVIYSKPLQSILPEKSLSSLSRLISVNPDMILYPGRPRSHRMGRLMEIPEDLQEDLIRKATR